MWNLKSILTAINITSQENKSIGNAASEIKQLQKFFLLPPCQSCRKFHYVFGCSEELFHLLSISDEFDNKLEGFLIGDDCFPSYKGDNFLNLYCSRHINIKLILKSLFFEVMVAAFGLLCRRRNIQRDLGS